MKQDPKKTAERVAEIMNQPTQYVFDLTDVDTKYYTEAINVLFNDPKFKDAVEKRNRFVRSAGGLRQNSPEIINLVRIIQQHDRRLADTLFATLVMANLHAQQTYERMSIDEMLRQYVDMTQEGAQERADQLKLNLDKLTFLADILDGILLDVKQSMDELTKGEVDFKQFDAVRDSLTLVKVFFGQVHGKDYDNPEAKLFVEYADSIDDYMTKRLKTYSEKLKKIRSVK